MANYIYSNGELMHYGIPGMKWGVRNTPEEKLARRRAKGEKKQARVVKKQNNLREDTAYQKSIIKDASVEKQSARAEELRSIYEKQELDRRISIDDFWTQRGLRKAQDRSFDLNITIKKAQETQLEYDSVIQTAIERINSNNIKISELDDKYVRIGKKYLGV